LGRGGNLDFIGFDSGFGDMQTRATENGYTLTTNLNTEQQAKLTALEQFNGRSFFRMPWEGRLSQAANDETFGLRRTG